MRAVIYFPFALSVVFVGLSRLVCRRSSPRLAAWSVTVAMVLLAGSTVAALALLAWPLVARLPLVAHLGGWQPGAVNHGVPVPESVSVLASVALAAVATLVVRQALRFRHGLVAIAKLHADLAPPSGLAGVTVVEDPRPSAHALPGTRSRPGVVVVSTGLLDALDGEERAAVLAHEHAHLAHAHRRFAGVAAVAAAMSPVLAPCPAQVAFALERWADEDAACRTTRTVTARALAKAALAKLSSVHDRVNLGVVMELGRLGAPARVAALLEPEPDRRRTVLVGLVAGLALVGMLAIVWATRDTEHLFEHLQRH